MLDHIHSYLQSHTAYSNRLNTLDESFWERANIMDERLLTLRITHKYHGVSVSEPCL